MCHHFLAVFIYWLGGRCPEVFDVYGFSWNFSSNIYIYFLALTLLFETPIYYFLLKREFPALKILRISLVVNLLTHPLVFLVFPQIADHYGITYGWYVLYAESFAFIVECLALCIVFKTPVFKSIQSSLAANLFSWLIGGEIVQYFLK